MGENSKIQWTDHTFNPWIGCTKVAPECVRCYAERQDKHYKWNGGTWGPGAPRTLTSESNWQLPFRWNRAAAAAGVPARVFAASLADLWDDEAPNWPGVRALPGRGTAWLTDETTVLDVFFHEVIAKTESLIWLLLTKRFERCQEYLTQLWGSKPWPNVQIIFSAGTQATVDRAAGVLRKVPAAVRGLSVEPLLEAVELGPALEFLDWVIVGGESGPGARPMHPDWPRSLRAQCQAAGVSFFFKQWGEWKPTASGNIAIPRVIEEGLNRVSLMRDGTICIRQTGLSKSERSIDARGAEVLDRWHRWQETLSKTYPFGPPAGVVIQDPFGYEWMVCCGKEKAGFLLDGRQWHEFPRGGDRRLTEMDEAIFETRGESL